MADKVIDANAELGLLKDFQRRTVRHVFHHLYKRQNSSRRFLVADEVGLGKTMVARGIVAKAIEHLEEEGIVDRIDIVYVCSNAAIAQQNINRLNVTGEKEYALATRLTLLPLELRNLGSRKINFVSFTPGTTFDLKNTTGVWKERRLLFHLLSEIPGLDKFALRTMLRCGVGKKRWRQKLSEPLHYDKVLVQSFLDDLTSDSVFRAELDSVLRKFQRGKTEWPKHHIVQRNQLIGNLRKRLASACVEALEPDLVILDEFQRFKDLLSGESEAGELAQELMNYPDVRVLLLSATPYKMLTLYGEEENHYEDFLHTLRFLYDNERHVKRIRKDLDAFRVALYEQSSDGVEIRDRLQKRLRKVMVRTERVPVTKDRDAMVLEPKVETTLLPQDLHRASALDSLTQAIGAQEAIEYWKSAPYLLNFMKGYKLKEQFRDHVERNIDISGPLSEMSSHLISKKQLSNYEEIDPGNSRLRALVDRTLANDEWKLLWLPASLPYAQSETSAKFAAMTKSLVFSTWNVVPDVIAAVCSYIAERRRVLVGGRTNYFKLYESRKGLLVFRRTDDNLDSMSTLLLLYPSPTLAKLIDPLKLAWQRGSALAVSELQVVARERAEKLVTRMPGARRKKDGRRDQAWYWAAIARRDSRRFDGVNEWLNGKSGWRSLIERKRGDRDSSIFAEHVQLFSEGAIGDVDLGAVPVDLVNVLADLAVGSPAICASRALRRIAPGLKRNSPEILQASAEIAEGFRSLFNAPDVRSMLEKDGVPYWREVLRYCAEHDLQAVMDEYVHGLKESLGLMEISPEKVVYDIATTIRGVLSIRTSSLDMDDISVKNGKVRIKKRKMRCRYALRFGDLKDDSDEVLQRAGVVREAFNSPFRPFILASTSVGQEGLDFHSYCHRVWHWNLPSNPVDMEQREGRVNRYKGHAVRKNVARAIGFDGLAKEWKGWGDPWDALFKIAGQRVRENGEAKSELMPFWIFEGVENPARVERLVPLPPFSSENAKFKALKKSLAVYRLAFGQPRQEDLIEFLADNADGADINKMRELQINLQP